MDVPNGSMKVDDELARLILTPRAYAERTALYHGFCWLRANNPVGRVEVEGYDPFWAVTKHADILAVSRQNDLFHSADNPTVLRPRAAEDLVRSMQGGYPHLLRIMVNMDAPEHMKYRRITQGWLMPQKLQSLESRIRMIAREAVDRMASHGGECDFARDVALHYPLRVVMEILGVPEQDEPRMLKLTQEIFGSDDEDLRRDARAAGDPIAETNSLLEVIADFEEYFARLTATRRADPRDDIATIIAHAEIEGAPIAQREATSYYILIATAGHDTTSSSTSGAIWALCEHPDEFRKVKADRSLISKLIEEAVRYTVPVGHFMRTATEDTELRGQAIAKGDRLMLCYPSGNRDEEVFDAPDLFRVDRDATRHVGFGHGVHVCLGQHLARLEMRIFFEELFERLESIELAGEPRRSASTFVGGPKTVPVRFRMS
ncbi:MAG: cytochrome P450 [Bradyrhizobium sp.]|uniref:cytochrome P450 n=1 Tax=Bradyrhizobium sp. TaxID=376 RepID=UPI001D528DD9|nr:cytochrome P450 [Bradyrhizobium sp.]MBV9560787.1 cytochrome P450 [Bradyrhizobium sp.]